MRAVILVPRREDNGWRDTLWQHVKNRLAAWDVFEGHHTAEEGPFNRSAAINRAAVAAGDWDVAVIVDSDTIVGDNQIDDAVRQAAATDRITFGFVTYRALNPDGTARILAGWDGAWEPFIDWEAPNTASSCVAVSRHLWEQVGGFDDRFVGWGWEDCAFSIACQTLGGGWNRIEGPVWHLWHPPSPDAGNTGSPIWQANRRRYTAYEAAVGDPARMRQVCKR